jgi:hypothetical protein
MAIENTISIQLSDINAVEFECKKCGTKTVRKLDDEFQLPSACGNCSDSWFYDGSEKHHELRDFFARLRYQIKNAQPFNLRWHVSGLGVQTGVQKLSNDVT